MMVGLGLIIEEESDSLQTDCYLYSYTQVNAKQTSEIMFCFWLLDPAGGPQLIEDISLVILQVKAALYDKYPGEK